MAARKPAPKPAPAPIPVKTAREMSRLAQKPTPAKKGK